MRDRAEKMREFNELFLQDMSWINRKGGHNEVLNWLVKNL